MDDQAPLPLTKEEGKDSLRQPVPGELAALVREEVRQQLDAERVVVKGAAEIAFKIIVVAFVILIGVFTVFGITTWQEIKRETASYVKSQADELIMRTDHEAGVKGVLNDLVNRTIVNASLVELQRNPGKKIELPLNAWTRLKTWIQQPGLGRQEFADALSVLDAQPDGRKDEDANGLLSDMLAPSAGSEFEWMRKQPDKRLALMASFAHTDLGSSAMTILSTDGLSEELRIAAAAYIRRVQYKDGFDKLLKLAETLEMGQLKLQVFAACAALRPSHPKFIEMLKSVAKADKSVAIRLSSVAVKELLFEPNSQRTPAEEDGDVEALSQATQELLAFLLTNRAQFEVVDPSSDSVSWLKLAFGAASRRSTDLDALQPRVHLAVPRGSSTRRQRVASIQLDEFAKIGAYWQLVSKLANDGDLGKLGTHLPVSADNVKMSTPLWNVSVKLALGPDSKVGVTDSTGTAVVLTGKTHKELVIRRASREQGDINAQWTDQDAKETRGKVTSLSGGGFRLTLMSERNLPSPTGAGATPSSVGSTITYTTHR